MIGHANAFASDPRFRRDMRHLFSFDGVSDPRISCHAVRAVTKLNPFGPGARRAVVVRSDAAYGVARMYELSRDPARDELQVFRDLESALGWLGLAAAKAEVLAALAAVGQGPSAG